MHEFYRRKAPKLKKAMNGLLKPVSAELEEHSKKPFIALFEEIWDHYEKICWRTFRISAGML